MLRRGTQRVLVGQGGICRIILCRDAAVVPQAQNAAHRNVYGAVCSFVCDPAKLQKRYNIAIYLDGGLSRIVVYGFQIVYAVVAVVYIVKPMQSCKLFCDRLRFFIKTFLSLKIARTPSSTVSIITILNGIVTKIPNTFEKVLTHNTMAISHEFAFVRGESVICIYTHFLKCQWILLS